MTEREWKPELVRIAAFSTGARGGNPAGVWLGPQLPGVEEMQRIAAEVGFSETAFAAPLPTPATPVDEQAGPRQWRVRYFSPAAEVPFCGHATIALGVALARRVGAGEYQLQLNQATISVSSWLDGEGEWQAALQSPPTRSKPAPAELVSAALALFGYTQADLDPRIPPALIHGGADHLVLALNSRAALAAMHYQMAEGRTLMQQEGLVTILLAYAPASSCFIPATPLPMVACMRIPLPEPPPRPLPVTCEICTGPTAASSISFKGKIWGWRRTCMPRSPPSPAAQSGYLAAPA